MKDSWKYHFRSIILERGEEYYYSGFVDDLQEDEEGCHAIVHGSEDYDVDIVMKNGKVTDMDCTCPYAADGSHCKHEAAVLYAIFEGDQLKRSNSNSLEESLDEILDSMNEEQLRMELKTILKEDTKQAQRIYNVYRRHKADDADVKNAVMMLDGLAYEFGDRYGFVDWRSGMDYVSAFEECLRETVHPMFSRKEYREAFYVLKEAYRIIETVEMDGSSGEHSMVIDHIEEDMDTLIHLCDMDLKDAIYEWIEDFLDADDDHWMISESLERLYHHSFDDAKYLEKQLKEVKEMIKEPQLIEYRLEESLALYLDILKRLGKDEKEYEDFLLEHDDLVAVKKICLKRAEEKDDFDSMLQILKELCEKEEHSYQKQEYLDRMYEIYERKGDKENQKKILLDRILSDSWAKIDKVRKLRSLCTKEEWGPYREEILKIHKGMAPAIYSEEGLFDKLISILPSYPFETADAYFEKLKDLYPSAVLKLYMDHMYKLEMRPPCATLYAEEKETLLKIIRIKGGQKKALQLMKQWREKYPTRKAMYRIFDEVEKEM